MPDIRAGDLFMVMRELRRGACRGLPAGYRMRRCREDEVEAWALVAAGEDGRATALDYYARLYRPQAARFHAACHIVATDTGQAVGTALLWRAYGGRLTTLHWLRVLPAHEGQGIGRALLSALLGEAPTPVYLHTHVGALRALALYADFGFELIRDPRIGGRHNALERALPFLEAQLPPALYARLRTTEADTALLEAAASAVEPEF